MEKKKSDVKKKGLFVKRTYRGGGARQGGEKRRRQSADGRVREMRESEREGAETSTVEQVHACILCGVLMGQCQHCEVRKESFSGLLR